VPHSIVNTDPLLEAGSKIGESPRYPDSPSVAWWQAWIGY
jgi:hypothetical protein